MHKLILKILLTYAQIKVNNKCTKINKRNANQISLKSRKPYFARIKQNLANFRKFAQKFAFNGNQYRIKPDFGAIS